MDVDKKKKVYILDCDEKEALQIYSTWESAFYHLFDLWYENYAQKELDKIAVLFESDNPSDIRLAVRSFKNIKDDLATMRNGWLDCYAHISEGEIVDSDVYNR